MCERQRYARMTGPNLISKNDCLNDVQVRTYQMDQRATWLHDVPKNLAGRHVRLLSYYSHKALSVLRQHRQVFCSVDEQYHCFLSCLVALPSAVESKEEAVLVRRNHRAEVSQVFREVHLSEVCLNVFLEINHALVHLAFSDVYMLKVDPSSILHEKCAAKVCTLAKKTDGLEDLHVSSLSAEVCKPTPQCRIILG